MWPARDQSWGPETSGDRGKPGGKEASPDPGRDHRVHTRGGRGVGHFFVEYFHMTLRSDLPWTSGQPISERAGVLCEFYTHCIFPNQIINSLVGGQIKVHQEEQQLLGCFLSCCVFYRSWAGSLRSPWFSNSWLFEPRWKFLYTLYPASIGWQLRRLWL